MARARKREMRRSSASIDLLSWYVRCIFTDKCILHRKWHSLRLVAKSSQPQAKWSEQTGKFLSLPISLTRHLSAPSWISNLRSRRARQATEVRVPCEKRYCAIESRTIYEVIKTFSRIWNSLHLSAIMQFFPLLTLLWFPSPHIIIIANSSELFEWICWMENLFHDIPTLNGNGTLIYAWN